MPTARVASRPTMRPHEPAKARAQDNEGGREHAGEVV